MSAERKLGMRAAFEFWASRGGSDPDATNRYMDGYLFSEIDAAWAAWQAAWNACEEAQGAANHG